MFCTAIVQVSEEPDATGFDDGVTVTVDGARVFARDEARPEREDDDLVPDRWLSTPIG